MTAGRSRWPLAEPCALSPAEIQRAAAWKQAYEEASRLGITLVEYRRFRFAAWLRGHGRLSS